MRRISRSGSTALAIVAALSISIVHADPALVEDEAALLATDQKEKLSEYHAFLLRDHDIDYRVVTANDVGDINLYAVGRFKALDVGRRSRTGRGLLLVIDSKQDRVRLEVGYALEGVYPDAFVAYIEHRQMVPFFRVTRIADGILATTELIIARAKNAKANAGFADEVWVSGSGGGGATTRARLGQGRDGSFSNKRTEISGGSEPEETLKRYMGAMAVRNADPNLAIYTPATRRMLQGWIMTPAQMDNIVKTYRRCQAEATKIHPSGRRAVIRYRIRDRQCAPWFFELVDDAWALDLTMMQRAIRFGRGNSWHFDPRALHPYAYAFRDWRFDHHGYPR